jgi:hypothetical protein
MIEVLMRAVVESFVFLGMSNEEIIQPDAAVSQLEYLASILRSLAIDEQRRVSHFVRALAESEEREGGLTPRVKFLQELSENLGLMA